MAKKALAADAKAPDAKAEEAAPPAKAAPYPTNRHGTGAASDERAELNAHGKWSGYGAAPVYALPCGSPPREFKLPEAVKPTK